MQLPGLTYLLGVKHGLCETYLSLIYRTSCEKPFFLISGRLGEPLFVSQTTGLKNCFKAIFTNYSPNNIFDREEFYLAKWPVVKTQPHPPLWQKLPTNVLDWTQVTVLSWKQVAQGVQSPRGLLRVPWLKMQGPKLEGNFSGLLTRMVSTNHGGHLSFILVGSWLYWGVPRNSV